MKHFITFFESELKQLQMASGGHHGYGYLGTSKCKAWFPHIRKPLMRHILQYSLTIISKVSFPRFHLVAILDLYKLHKLP